jgi:hypothetical protein
MSTELGALLTAALSIGFFHTLIGPDHYLPFVMMARARKWSAARTAAVTFFCGIAHILSSVLLGLVGIFFGVALQKLVLSNRSGQRGRLASSRSVCLRCPSFKQMMKTGRTDTATHEDGRSTFMNTSSGCHPCMKPLIPQHRHGSVHHFHLRPLRTVDSPAAFPAPKQPGGWRSYCGVGRPHSVMLGMVQLASTDSGLLPFRRSKIPA